MRCFLATSKPYVSDGKPLATDDQLLQRALSRQGIEAEVVPWEEPCTWDHCDLAILRSTWNYHLHYETFLAWVRTVAEHTVLLNPLPVVLWNSHKQRYLSALATRGVPTIPTLWLPRGTYRLEPLVRQTGWQRAVLKPCVGGNSYRTRLVTEAILGDEHDLFRQWLTEQDMMLQPYLASVEEAAEQSFVFIEGSFRHAFLKRPFAVQTANDLDEPQVFPAPQEIAFATEVLHLVHHLFHLTQPLLYARVDLVRDQEASLRVMEVELIEPLLHLEYGTSLTQLCDAIGRRLHHLTATRGRVPLPA